MTILLGVLLAATAAPTSPPPPPMAGPAKAAGAELSRADVMAAVRAEWPAYDHGGKGRLSPLEFSTWVIRAHGGTVAARPHGAGMSPVSAMNASATAFASADANHDGGVTPEEMVAFLTRARRQGAARADASGVMRR